MSLTQTQARDAINAAFKAALDAYNTANATSYAAVYQDVPTTPTTAAHFRVFINHGSGDQQTLAGVGNRRFSRAGVVIVQIMTPFGDGFTLADKLVTVPRNAFEGVSTSNGVWFRRVSPGIEAGKTGDFYQMNVTANFTYTERR